MQISTCVVSTLFLGLATSLCYGQAYSPDPAFGTVGKATITFPTSAATDNARSLLLLPNGTIVVAGRNNELFGLARLTSLGQPDLAFGTAGTLTTAFAPPSGASPNTTIRFAEPTSLLLQTDGKMIAAGWLASYNPIPSGGPSYRGYARYLPSGALDGTFDGDGKVVSPNNEGSLGSYITGIQQQADGKLLSVSRQMLLTGSLGSPIYRLTEDGTVDNTYTWTYPTAIPNSTGPVYDKTVAASALDASGRLITAGVHFVSNQNYTGPQGPALVRYTSTGQPDSGFGTGGITILPMTDNSIGLEWSKIVLQPDGKILAASLQTRYAGSSVFVDSVSVARYQPSGILDPTFGRQGVATVSFHGATNAARGATLCGLQLLPSGTIVAGVQTVNANFSVVQITANGRPASTPILTQLPNFQAADMTLQPDGKVLIAGTSSTAAGTRQFAVVRLLPASLLSTTNRVSSGQLDLYPNPAAQKITLRLTGLSSNQLVQLHVFDAVGREVFTLLSARLVGGEIQIPLHTIRPGSYTLRVQGTDFMATYQFLRSE